MNPPAIGKYALITGGSEGIGKALALECASRGMNLVLVALPGEHFPRFGSEIRKTYGLDVRILELDLCDEDAPQKVYDYCKVQEIEVSVLMNNAGVGFLGEFKDGDAGQIRRLLMLNDMATVMLTRLFIADLIANKPSYILNTGSLAGLSPIPFKSVYSASKAFVYTFSRSLREELRPHGVGVSVLSPGAVLTNENTHRASASLGYLARLGTISPANVAQKAVSRMLRRKAHIVPGIFNVGLRILQTLLSDGRKVRVAAGVFRKTQKDKTTY